MLDLRSDNTAGVTPEVMAAMAAANEGHAMGYGADPWTLRLRDELAALFETDDFDLVPALTGTGANALATSLACPGYGAIVCHPLAHVAVDECNAPIMFTGGAAVLSAGELARRFVAADVEALLGSWQFGSMHSAQPKVLVVAEASERGHVHSVEEIRAFADTAHRYGLALMMDGARFANALAATGASPADLSWRAGVDLLVFGATKNGAMAAEAILLFGKARTSAAPFLRKRSGQVQSKGRYLAAQFSGMLGGGAWLERAAHANRVAKHLADGLVERGARLLHPVEANLVFTVLPEPLQAQLAEHALFYTGFEEGAVRLVGSWSTPLDRVDAILDRLR